jgi:hypothetical protein
MADETPDRRSQHHSAAGRLGAYTMLSRNDPKETTKAGRSAFLAKFEQQVDPQRQLEPEERGRRATMARRAYFARLAMKSAQTRARRRIASSGGRADR